MKRSSPKLLSSRYLAHCPDQNKVTAASRLKDVIEKAAPRSNKTENVMSKSSSPGTLDG
jgi:hypothetical protein